MRTHSLVAALLAAAAMLGCQGKTDVSASPAAVQDAVTTIRLARVVHGSGPYFGDQRQPPVRYVAPQTAVYRAYLTLVQQADEETLIDLLDDDSPAVRAYATFALCERDLERGRELTRNMRNDGERVRAILGPVAEIFEVRDLAIAAHTQPLFLRYGTYAPIVAPLMQRDQIDIYPATGEDPDENGEIQRGGDPLDARRNLYHAGAPAAVDLNDPNYASPEQYGPVREESIP